MAHRKPQLENIIKDLKVFVSDACRYVPEQPNDFVSEICNDACLMLEQARDELHKREIEGKP
jgi:adenylate kinase